MAETSTGVSAEAAPDREPQGGLKPFGPEIWIVDGPAVVAAAGFHYPTRMAIVRLADGGLFAWSPVALDAVLRAQVEALGPVHHLVAPNTLHHLHLPAWKAAFPAARVHAAPADWARDIDQVVLRGNRITTEVVFLHRQSGTALFTDLLQQLPSGWFTGWRALVAHLDLMTGKEPRVPRKFRLAFTDRRAAREAVGRILAWPVERVVMAHGTPVTRDGQAFLRRAFAWLKV